MLLPNEDSIEEPAASPLKLWVKCVSVLVFIGIIPKETDIYGTDVLIAYTLRVK